MTDLIYDFISTGVDLLLISSVLAAMIVMLRGSTQLTQMISEQEITSQEFDYYLQFHAYDNQEGLSSADALSCMCGYRFDIWVCINTGSAIYLNDPDTGKYYSISSTAVGKTTAEAKQLCATGTKISYEDLASALNPSWKYKARLLTLNGATLEAEDFSRNLIVNGIYFEVY